ncbi:MAG: S8 family peptidase [Planctomycetota bacterium]
MRIPPSLPVMLVILALSASASAGDQHVLVGCKGGTVKAMLNKYGGDRVGSLDVIALRVPAAAVAKLRANPNVAYVEENGIASIHAPGGKKGKPDGGGSTTPPPQERPWGVHTVGGGIAANTGAGIKIAVIDTGIDTDHEDLAANVKGGIGYVKGESYEDDHGHGSHCAGTIAALDNDRGVIGVAPEAHIWAVKVLDRRGSGRWGDVANGITWSADNGMQIANMSIGGGYSKTVEAACSYATTNGVLLIAAAGNSGDGSVTTNEYSYPASYSTVVSVGATDAGDGLASFSNTNPLLEVAGPGVGVRSTYRSNGYRTWNGTSMACPHAVGVAALIWKETAGTRSTVRTALQDTARDVGGDPRGYGNGIVLYVSG